MRVIAFIIGWLIYAYYMINMLIDIESFGDFIVFLIVGAIVSFIFRIVIMAIIAILPE